MRKLGILLCMIGLVAVFALPLFILDSEGPFGSLRGIEADLTAEALKAVPAGVDVEANGQSLTVLGAEFDEDIDAQLNAIDGVRSVTWEAGENIRPGDTDPDEADEPPAAPTEVSDTPDPDTPDPDTPDPDTPDSGVAADPQDEPEAPAVPEVDADEVVEALTVVDIVFLPDTATLTGSDTGTLTNVANALQNVDNGPIEVQAHMSNEGDPDVNQLLSEERAQAVVDFLVDQGVDPQLLVPRGYGASQPIDSRDTPEGRDANERVTFALFEG